MWPREDAAPMTLFDDPPDDFVTDCWRSLIPNAFPELRSLVGNAAGTMAWDQVEENLALWGVDLLEDNESRRLQRLTEMCRVARRACEPDAQLREQFGSAWEWDAYRQLRGEPLDLLPGAPVSVPIVVADGEQLTGRLLSLQVTLLAGNEAPGANGRVYRDPEQWYLVLDDDTFLRRLTKAWEMVIDEITRGLLDVHAETLRGALCRFRLTSMDRTPTHEVPLIGGPSAQAAFAVAAYTACRRAVGLPVLDLDGRMIVSATVKKQEDTISLGPVEFLDAKLAAIRRADLPGGGRIVVSKAFSAEEIEESKDKARDRCRTEGMKGIPDLLQIGTFRELHELLTNRATLTRRYLERARQLADETHWKHRGQRGTIKAQDIWIPLDLLKHERVETECDGAEEDRSEGDGANSEPLETDAPPRVRKRRVVWREELDALLALSPGTKPSVALVCGPAGAGKSFLAKRTAFEVAVGGLGETVVCPTTGYSPVLPFLVPATELMERNFPLDGDAAELADFLARRGVRSIGLASDEKKHVRELLRAEIANCRSGRVLLLVDALDEAGADVAVELKRRLGMLRQVLQHPMILTCRVEQAKGFEEIGSEDTDRYELPLLTRPAPDEEDHRYDDLPLHQAQKMLADSSRRRRDRLVSEFITDWFRNTTGANGTLQERLRETPSLQALAELPLGLTLLCLCHERHAVGPQTRLGDIYETVLRSWLGREWHPDQSSDPDDVTADLDDLAAVIAWLFRRGPDTPSFNQRDFVAAFTETNCGDKTDARETLKRLAHRGTGVLQRSGQLYSMAHAQFRDYLVAYAWSAQIELGPEAWPELLQNLDNHAWLPAWRAPITFLVDLLDDQKRQELLGTLRKQTKDDLLSHRARLADACENGADLYHAEGPPLESVRTAGPQAWRERRPAPIWMAWEDLFRQGKPLLDSLGSAREVERLDPLCKSASKAARASLRAGPVLPSLDVPPDAYTEAVSQARSTLASRDPCDVVRGLYVFCRLGFLLNRELKRFATRQERALPRHGKAKSAQERAAAMTALSSAIDDLANVLLEQGLPALRLSEERRHQSGLVEGTDGEAVVNAVERLLVSALTTAAGTQSPGLQQEVARAVGRTMFAQPRPLALELPERHPRNPLRRLSGIPKALLLCPEVAGVWIRAMLPYLEEDYEGPFIEASMQKLTVHARGRAFLVRALVNGVRRPDLDNRRRALRVTCLSKFASALEGREDAEEAGHEFTDGTPGTVDGRTLKQEAVQTLWEQWYQGEGDQWDRPSYGGAYQVRVQALKALTRFSPPEVNPRELLGRLDELLAKPHHDHPRSHAALLAWPGPDSGAGFFAIRRWPELCAQHERIVNAARATVDSDAWNPHRPPGARPRRTGIRLREWAWRFVGSIAPHCPDQSTGELLVELLLHHYLDRWTPEEMLEPRAFDERTERTRGWFASEFVRIAQEPKGRPLLQRVLGKCLPALLRIQGMESPETGRLLERLDAAGFRFFPGTGQVGDIRTGKLTPAVPSQAISGNLSQLPRRRSGEAPLSGRPPPTLFG
jgi:hypothetical protein